MTGSENSDHKQRRRNITGILTIIGLIGEMLATSNKAKAGDEQRKANETALVRATQKTAFATFVIAVAAILTFGAAIIQAVIFNRQLTTMQGQLHEMERTFKPVDEQAKAATSAAKTANDALLKAQRPFLFQKGVWYRPFIKEGNALWRALIEWENSGVTPTTFANFELMCPPAIPNVPGTRMLVDPYALKKVPFIPKDKIIHVSTILGPKQSKFGGQCEFTPDDLVKIQNMVATQYIIAEVTYGDIFEQSHITRFCEIIIHISGNVPGFDPRYLVAPVFGIVVPMSNAKRKMKSPTCHRKSSVSDRTHIPRK